MTVFLESELKSLQEHLEKEQFCKKTMKIMMRMMMIDTKIKLIEKKFEIQSCGK